jgi:membrane protein
VRGERLGGRADLLSDEHSGDGSAKMKLWKWAFLGAAGLAAGALSRPAEAPLAQAAGAAAQIVRPPQKRAFLIRVYQYAMEDRLFAVAAGVAFYALIALAPTLAVAVSLFGLFMDPKQVADLPTALAPILPSEAISLVENEARRLASEPSQSLSIKLAVGLALSIWGASAAVRASFDALNVIDEQEETRSILRLYATALATTLAGLIVFVFAIVIIGANPGFVALGEFSQETIWLYGMLRWPVFFVIAVLSLNCFYWVAPSRPPAPFWKQLPGATVAALVWAIASSAFGWYVAALGNYTATYGSLATVVVVMTWLWFSAAIMLLGAQINFALTHDGTRRRARPR